MLKSLTKIIAMVLLSTACNAQVPAYLNADVAKQKLSSSPLKYHFTDKGTRYEAHAGATTVEISFDPSTKRISTMRCNLDVNSMHPSLADAKPIFDFLEALNTKAAAYYKTRFKGMIESKKTYDDTDPYIDRVQKLRYSFDHSLFDARELKKSTPSYVQSNGTLYLTAEVNRLP